MEGSDNPWRDAGHLRVVANDIFGTRLLSALRRPNSQHYILWLRRQQSKYILPWRSGQIEIRGLPNMTSLLEMGGGHEKADKVREVA